MHNIMLSCPLAYLLGLFGGTGETDHFWSISPAGRGALYRVFYAPRLILSKLHVLSRHRGASWGERGA